MIDISHKIKTLRTAVAQATLKVSPETITRIQHNNVPKGNPLEVAKVAAVQAAKHTSGIIPYCHPLPVDFVGVEFEMNKHVIEIRTTVKAIYKTGVEMEALTAASVAALTMYDMLKMFDDEMEITGVKLVSKTGGKSQFGKPVSASLRAAVLVLSDSVSAGKKEDSSGRLIQERLKSFGVKVTDYKVIADDRERIEIQLKQYADKQKLDLVVTTGGTGFGPRDNAPEAIAHVIEREAPGIVETARVYGQERTPLAMLSRAKAGVRGTTLIISMPGSRKAVAESLDALFPAVLHAFAMIAGGSH
ncbi:MAG: bifunctional molybdenum cofactor biosynthesis protein MoaC/MoaB [Bacteroidota bacterium]|nr:bifunctional molybdenum cofactor biosynthesis protein MoaC/MoaB [Bacteroidota bacterium]